MRTEKDNIISKWIEKNQEDWQKILGFKGGLTAGEYMRILETLRENDFIELTYAFMYLHSAPLAKYLPTTREDMENYIMDYCERMGLEYSDEVKAIIKEMEEES